MICNNSKSEMVPKFISKYINTHTHDVPRKNYMDQGTSFTLKAVREFCYTEGIEIVYSPVNEHRANGCVERIIGCINNLVLIYVKEESHRTSFCA